PQLMAAIKYHLAQEGQVLIFINRRGFSPTIICHSCGWSSQCHRCDARLTYHQTSQQLICHHCGSRERVVKTCTACGGSQLIPLGVGTERIEEALKSEFGDVGLVRIDRDSTQKKGSFHAILDDILSGKSRLFVGTQMIAKGHHFPNLTLTAILDADGGFLSSNLRASERMGQLITQVAGRAGRAQRPGEVIIQTRHPDNRLLMDLIDHNYNAFSKHLLQERREAQLPPFFYLTLLRADAYNIDQTFSFLNKIKKISSDLTSSFRNNELQVMGPVPAPLQKRAGKFRGQLLFQSNNRKRIHLHIDRLIDKIEQLKISSSVRWSLDVDPIDLF
ncbi:unnamed protein product, partial [marine sediment metagenome]